MARKTLSSSRVDALIEFGRAVHAEADALASAARLGKSPIGADLFCTTFPCHLCAKQIVSSGIRTVTFIEPYPKSLAKELHDDAIALEEASGRKMLFKPFIGVAPHRYAQLFSSVDFTGKEIARKAPDGRVKRTCFTFGCAWPRTIRDAKRIWSPTICGSSAKRAIWKMSPCWSRHAVDSPRSGSSGTAPKNPRMMEKMRERTCGQTDQGYLDA